jgi:single-strand DNA-binding protein
VSAQNSFQLAGRLAADPEVHTGNTARARIRLAVDGYDFQTKQKKADFFSVTLFGRKADIVAQYCRKGSFVIVSGTLRENNYTDKQGNKRYETQLVADDISLGPKAAASDEDPGDDPFGIGGSRSDGSQYFGN